MATNYPGALDTTTNLPDTIVDGVASLTVHANYHNNANDAIIAIETALGITPQGSYASVVARLNDTVVKTPASGSQIIKPSLDERALILRPFSDSQTNKLVEFQNAAGGSVLASVDKLGNADFVSYKVGGVALASTNLSDSGNLARTTTTNTFTLGQTISANAGLTISGNGGKVTLALTNTGSNTGLTIGADTTLYRSAANTLATDGSLVFPQAAGTTVVLQTTIAGVLAHQMKASGLLEWATGAGTVDTNWYRRGAGLIGSDYTVDVALDMVARSAATAQTKIGAFGPSSEAALQLGNATAFTLYKSGSNTATTTGTISAAALQISGTALASTHLSDTAALARLASPTFTGTPAAPTAAVDTNTTQLASTAFVLAQASAATPLVDGAATIGTSTRFARADHIHPTDTSRAALASPALTGTPTAPTAAPLSNSTQVATTAYVDLAVASGVPTGTTVPFAGYTAPTGWLFADASQVSRTTYATLMTVTTFTQSVTTTNLSTTLTVADSSVMFAGMPIEGTGIPASTTVSSITNATTIVMSAAATASATVTSRFFPHGNGDGSTTFHVPDLRGRAVHGKGTHADVAAIGKTDGVAVSSRTPKHSHTVNSHTHDIAHSHTLGSTASGATATSTDAQGSHSHGGGTGNAGNHSHNVSTSGPSSTVNVSGTGAFGVATNNHTHAGSTDAPGDHAHSIGTDGSHSHNVSSHTHDIAHSHTLGSTASGAATPGTDTQLSPYLTLNHIIKT